MSEGFRQCGAHLGAERHFDQLHALIGDDGIHGLAVARVERARDQHLAGFRFAVGTQRHEDGFGQARRTVIHRGVGHVHAGEAGHHGLVFVNGLQGALARLGLVRRVGGVELTTGDQLPHRCRNVMLIGTGTDKTDSPFILLCPRRHDGRDFHFRQAVGQLFQLAGFQVGRNFIKQVLDALGTNGVEHGADVVIGMRDIGHDSAVPGATGLRSGHCRPGNRAGRHGVAGCTTPGEQHVALVAGQAGAQSSASSWAA
jgi:hypothetical protein